MAREFEGVDFERHEDEKLLKEFVKLYSFYISDCMHVYKTTKKALASKFSVIKDDIIELARKGSKKALAFLFTTRKRQRRRFSKYGKAN